MNSFRKTFLFTMSVVFLALIVFPVAAQIDPISGGDFGLPDGGGGDAAGVKDLAYNIISVALGFVGIIALIILIYGGVQYIISMGDEGKTESAKKTILYAIIGLLVIGLAAAIVNFVITAIGGGSGST